MVEKANGVDKVRKRVPVDVCPTETATKKRHAFFPIWTTNRDHPKDTTRRHLQRKAKRKAISKINMRYIVDKVGDKSITLKKQPQKRRDNLIVV